MIEEIAPGIYTIEHSVADGKNGIVFGDRTVLAIDTGNSDDDGRAMVDFIRAQNRAPEWLALTHGHGDHVFGSPAFTGALVFGHNLAAATIRRQIPLQAKRTGRSEAAIAAEMAWPHVTFDHELRLDLGGKHVRLFHTPGHSADSVCALVEEDAILFGGDTAVTGIVPAFADGDSRQMEASLRQLVEVPAEVLVAGHGPVLRGRNRIGDWLTWMAEYLAGVREHIQHERASGKDEDEIISSLDYDSFVGPRLPRETHTMLRRHQNTARAMLREASRAHTS